MGVDLCFGLYFAVNEPECGDRKIKVFTVPVALSQRQFLSQSGLVDLDDVDAVSLKIQDLIPYRERDLKDALLDGDVLSRE